MQNPGTLGAVRADSSTGTPVSLVVPGVAPAGTAPGRTAPGHAVPPSVTPPHHLPFTGFELVPVLLAAVLLVALGGALSRLGRRARAVPVPQAPTLP